MEPATGCLRSLGPSVKSSTFRCRRRCHSSSFWLFRLDGCIRCLLRAAAKRQHCAVPVAILPVSFRRLRPTPSSKIFAINPVTAITPVLSSTTVALITAKPAKVIFIDSISSFDLIRHVIFIRLRYLNNASCCLLSFIAAAIGLSFIPLNSECSKPSIDYKNDRSFMCLQ